MLPKDTYFVLSEVTYHRDRTRRAIAAQRAGRSRSSWLRRMNAADKSA